MMHYMIIENVSTTICSFRRGYSTISSMITVIFITHPSLHFHHNPCHVPSLLNAVNLLVIFGFYLIKHLIHSKISIRKIICDLINKMTEG